MLTQVHQLGMKMQKSQISSYVSSSKVFPIELGKYECNSVRCQKSFIWDICSILENSFEGLLVQAEASGEKGY